MFGTSDLFQLGRMKVFLPCDVEKIKTSESVALIPNNLIHWLMGSPLVQVACKNY